MSVTLRCIRLLLCEDSDALHHVQATWQCASHAAAAVQAAVQCGQFTDLNFKQGIAVCSSGVKHIRELT